MHTNRPYIVPDSDITFRYARASGPGGQHVNKAATKVEARFNIGNLPGDLQYPASTALRSRLTAQGDLVVVRQRERSRNANKREAITALRALIIEATAPTPERIATVQPVRAKETRLRQKKRRGDIKRNRKPVEAE